MENFMGNKPDLEEWNDKWALGSIFDQLGRSRDLSTFDFIYTKCMLMAYFKMYKTTTL